MRYRSTRSETDPVDSSLALLTGLAPDGGLYVPCEFPALDGKLLDKGRLEYSEVAFRVLRAFFDDLPAAEMRAAAIRASGLFDHEAVAPLVRAGEFNILELFHGPTLAFKDLALTLFGSLLSLAKRAAGVDEELLVIVATSGDTGSAALSGLEGLAGIRVVVLYPSSGVSQVQRLQMTTRSAENLLVLGIRGNFDDAQRIAKTLLVDEATSARFAERGALPCSANSINIGRLVPQIAYYVHAWRALRAAGSLGADGRLDVVVPSGNFGNVLAARYAKQLGLPLGNFLVATNKNRVLADFLSTGTYDRNRPFFVTTSPSMDILVSSNLERLLFEASGRKPARTAELMKLLQHEGRYSVTETERVAFEDFSGGHADDAAASEEIARVFRETGYLLDPHTATAISVLRKKGQTRPALVTATASPFKFAATVARALGLEAEADEFAMIESLASHAHLAAPSSLLALAGMPERHNRVLDLAEVPEAIHSWLGS